jgi:hypothetical protein
VTKDPPYRPHPHNLVGKEGCKKGVCTVVINNPEMVCSFTSLGIQCVKRKDVEDSLKLRESIKVDPFRTGFAHKNQASNIDLNVVRLCFQVFIEGPEKDKYTIPLPPVVCDPIYDKKAMSDLIITKLSHCSAPVSGGKEIILLCDRVTKDDVQVRFYEEHQGQLVWEGYADFQPNDVHKQVAISFRSPKYFDESLHHPVLINIQLRRPSDGHVSESRPFQLTPRSEDTIGMSRKRQKTEESTGELERYLMSSPPAQRDLNALNMSPPEFVRVPRFVPKVKADMTHVVNAMPSQSMVSEASSSWQPQEISHSQIPSLLIKKEPGSGMEASGYTPASGLFSKYNSSANNSNIVDGPLSEKLDSLDLDIDPNDLINDINFNNLMVNLDSGNNITFNSSGNITDNASTYATLNTPQVLEEVMKNPLSQFMQNDLSKRDS